MSETSYVAFVGLDWGDRSHAFACHIVPNVPLEKGTVSSDPMVFHRWLDELHTRLRGGLVAVATEGGSKPLLAALAEHPWIHVYPVHPATCDRYRRAFRPSGAKDDVPDAETLLAILREHGCRLQRLRLDTLETRQLAALTLARRHAVDRRTQVIAQMRTLLKTYYPQALELVGEELERTLALDFLDRWPQLATAKTARQATIRDFYLNHGVRSAELVKRRLEVLRHARALTTDPAVIEPAIMQLAMLVELVRVQQKHIAAFDRRIERAFNAHPMSAFFRELPGAGPIFAPRLLVAFGDDRTRYASAANLQMYAGVAPVQKKSGKQLWVHWRWLAPVFLRQTFVEWAAQTVIYCPWANAYYHRHKAAGKTRQAILRALAFKWIRVLWRCWQSGNPYSEQRYQAALKHRGSPLWADLDCA